MFSAQEAGVVIFRQTLTAFWSGLASAQAAGVTIALRMPILVQAMTDPFAWPARDEAFRAAAEKWEAGLDGAFGAISASAALWRNMVVQPGDMGALSRSVGRVANAAVRPAHARARDNARRLSRG